jgi:enoyl-CoA hydratase/carnithine racemase
MTFVAIETTDGCSRLRLSNTVANVLTIEVVRELSDAIRAAAGSASGVLLCGGDKFFSNGLDLIWALSRSRDQMREMFLTLGDLVLGMLECPVPIVGAIRGHAIGAGKTIFAACDVRYAGSGRVLIGMPEILLGLPNPYFADQLIRHIVGDSVATDLIYTGRLVSAESCVSSGLVSQICDKAVVEDEAWKKTLALAELSNAAFAECKAIRTAHLCGDIRANLAMRTDRLLAIWGAPDAQARLKAAAERLSK